MLTPSSTGITLQVLHAWPKHPCLQAAGQGDTALTPELMNCFSIRLSSEFCCCRTATSASRLALRVRMLLCKEGRELTRPQEQARSCQEVSGV